LSSKKEIALPRQKRRKEFEKTSRGKSRVGAKLFSLFKDEFSNNQYEISFLVPLKELN
jgi:hypothetical protein